ncbi:MAG: DUF4349 domain-containing protein [Candidatus Magasanikbacteria bacterium]
MQKIGRFFLWSASVLVLVAFGVLIIGLAQFLVNSKTHSTSVSSVGLESDYSYDQITGMGMSDGAVVTAVRSLAKTANMQMAASEIASPVNDTIASANTTERMIVKTGNLSIVVKDVRASIKAVSEYAVAQNGFVVNSNVYKSGLIPRGTITIRILSKKFDQGMNEVKALGEVVGEQSNGQDVTEEYIDLDAQLRNLQATEKQFLAILAKAVKIEDILNVQRELTNVRGNIERLQGRMKYLKQSADLSTITVNFSTDPEVLPAYDNSQKWKPWAEVKTAARALWEFGKGMVNVLIWLVIFIPVWTIVALIIWLVYKVYRRIQNDRHDINNLR